jgi:hypothetical protein
VLLAVVVGVLGAMAPSQALVRLPTADVLVAADRGGDELELERVAGRLGAGRLGMLLASGARDERVAALHALPLVDDGWARLPEIAHDIFDSDGEVASAAATCARRLAERLTPETRERDEVPSDVPARAAQELAKAAGQRALAPTLRVPAIEALAALRGVTRVDDKPLLALLGDANADVRRAAAESLWGVPAATDWLTNALVKDGSATVAAAAGAALCRDVPLVAPSVKPPAAAALPDQRASKLKEPARARLRALALDDNVPLTDRLELLPCLRVNRQPADQQTLDTLARRPPESLRRLARALGGR